MPTESDMNAQNLKATDAEIQAEIETKASIAPRVTTDDIEASIEMEHYFTPADCLGVDGTLIKWRPGADTKLASVSLNLLTVCVLVMKNGFVVTGESACASPENFNADIGRKIARQNAVQKIWSLLGYQLREKLAGK